MGSANATICNAKNLLISPISTALPCHEIGEAEPASNFLEKRERDEDEVKVEVKCSWT
jgi:hypothetical protein